MNDLLVVVGYMRSGTVYAGFDSVLYDIVSSAFFPKMIQGTIAEKTVKL